MVVKKYKKLRDDLVGGGNPETAQQTIREPFIYQETVAYPHNNDEGSYRTFKLLELDSILPFGYPTERYLNFLKNDVY